MVNIDKVINKDVNIQVEVAYNIMRQCLAAAELRGDENVYKELAELIMENFSGQTPDDRVLRNLSDKIKKLRDPLQPEKEMGMYTRTIMVLAEIAGITDYEAVKEKYKRSLLMPVMYTAKPWYFFNVLRVPRNGILKQNQYKWEYNDEHITLTGNVTAADEFTMPGDRHALWIKVNYEDKGEKHEAYFAEYINQTIIPAAKTGNVLAFFKKMQKISETIPAII